MRVVIGVDPHKGSHMAVAIDEREQQVARIQVRSGPRQVDQLERRHWVRRLPNAADRRSVLVEITDEGRAVTDRMLPVIRIVEKMTMEVLSERERAQLVKMFDKVLRRTAELASGDPIAAAGPRVRPERST